MIDNKFIDPIHEAVTQVLSTMANLDATLDKPAIKSDAKAHGDVTGIMSLIEEGARGSIAITFTQPVAIDIMNRMLGIELTEIDDMVMDMAGEFANMVAGVTNRLLEQKGYKFKMSLPTVVKGQDHEVIHKYKGQKILMPYSTITGEFFVEYCFEE